MKLDFSANRYLIANNVFIKSININFNFNDTVSNHDFILKVLGLYY
jgi:hypothetical protein